MKLVLWLPIDKQTNGTDFQIPSIENTKDVLCAAVASTEPIVAAAGDDEEGGWNNQQATPQQQNFSAYHKQGWIEILAYSRGVSSTENDTHVQDISFTSYVSDVSPAFEAYCLNRRVIPYSVFRVYQTTTNGVMALYEYEMEDVKITSVSSGGSGGERSFTENFTLEAKNVTYKIIKVELATTEFKTYQTTKWNAKTKTASRTIISEAARTALGVTDPAFVLDETDETQKDIVEKAKALGLIGTAPKAEKSVRVQVNKEPAIYKKVDLGTDLTRKNLIEKISEVIKTLKNVKDVTATPITNVYSGVSEIETDAQVLEIPELDTIFVQFSDQTFYGH